MKTIEEKKEIKLAKSAWKKANPDRRLYRTNLLTNIRKLIEISDFANNVERINK